MSLKKVMFRFEKNKEFDLNWNYFSNHNTYSKKRIEIENEIRNKFSKWNSKNAKIEIYVLTPKKEFFSTSVKNQIKISIYISDNHRQQNNINFSFNYDYYEDIFKSYIYNGKYKTNIFEFDDDFFNNIVNYTLYSIFKKDEEILNGKVNIKKGELGKLNDNSLNMNKQEYHINIYTLKKEYLEEIKNMLLKLTNLLLIQIEDELKENILFSNSSKRNKKYPISYNIPFVDTNTILNKKVLNRRLRYNQLPTEYKILNIREIF